MHATKLAKRGAFWDALIPVDSYPGFAALAASLGVSVEGGTRQNDEQKTESLTMRREYAQLGKRLGSLSVPDLDSVAKLEAEIATIAEKQLDPAQLEFSKSSTEAASERLDFAVPRGGW